MIFLNVKIMILLLISYIILTNVQSITSTSTFESEINHIVTIFIGQYIRNNETLLNEVKMAIEYVLLQKEHLETELRRMEDTIYTKFYEVQSTENNIKKKLKTFFRALSIYKAGASIDSIEKKQKPKDPEFCNHCLNWGHQETNCAYQKPRFFGWDNEIQEVVHVRRNHWYWMLEHRRDDVDIAHLSEYLQRLYGDETNYTSLLNWTADTRPRNIEGFKLLFCFALGEIRQRRDYLNTCWSIRNDDYLEDFPIQAGISIDRFIEIFLKALDKWVDFEEPVFLYLGDNSTSDTTTTDTMKPDVDKAINAFIGKDIRTNKTSLHEVKNAIQHVLLQKQTLQRYISLKAEEIRKKDKQIKGNYLDPYKTKLNTFSNALWIYKAAANYEYYSRSMDSPLCLNCYNWNHTTDNCKSSPNVTLNIFNTFAEGVYNRSENYFSLLQNGDELLMRLREEYESGNFTNKLKPKPENFQQFKFMFSKALLETHSFVNYLSNNYRNEAQMKEVNLYGVPLYEYAIASLIWKPR